jgi:hypothetical protein
MATDLMQRNMQMIALEVVKHCSFDTDDLTCHFVDERIVVITTVV